MRLNRRTLILSGTCLATLQAAGPALAAQPWQLDFTAMPARFPRWLVAERSRDQRLLRLDGVRFYGAEALLEFSDGTTVTYETRATPGTLLAASGGRTSRPYMLLKRVLAEIVHHVRTVHGRRGATGWMAMRGERPLSRIAIALQAEEFSDRLDLWEVGELRAKADGSAGPLRITWRERSGDLRVD